MNPRQRTLLIDLAVSAAIAILLLVLSPGLAVAALVALATLIVVGLSLMLGAARARRLGGRRQAQDAPTGQRPAAPRRRPRGY